MARVESEPDEAARRTAAVITGASQGLGLAIARAYAASKAAIVRFAESLALEVKGDGIDVNSIAPGAPKTRMMDELMAAGPATVGQAFFDRMKRIGDEGGTPLETGAALTVFLGSAASDGITGKLVSAIWDPWETLPEHLDDLRRTFTGRASPTIGWK